MKKTLLLLTLALAVFSAKADCYFTMGENDTLRVFPMYLNGYFEAPVKTYFDGRLNMWELNIDYDSVPGMRPQSATERSGMDVPYFDSSGTPCIHNAELNAVDSCRIISSIITVIGYWDYDGSGHYAPYGPVKWEAGHYACMFSILFRLYPNFHGGFITIDGTLNSGDDARGGTTGLRTFFKRIEVVVGYRRGDVDGNDVVNIYDVSALVNYLLTDEELDQYQLEAADFNQDGYVTIDDVTALTNYLLTS